MGLRPILILLLTSTRNLPRARKNPIAGFFSTNNLVAGAELAGDQSIPPPRRPRIIRQFSASAQCHSSLYINRFYRPEPSVQRNGVDLLSVASKNGHKIEVCGGTPHVPAAAGGWWEPAPKLRKKGQPINKLQLKLAVIISAISFASSASTEVVFDSVSIRSADSVKKFDGMGQHGVQFNYRVLSEKKAFWIPTSLDLGLGWVELGGDSAAWFSFGPTYRFHLSKSDHGRWFTELASHPTYLSGSDFGGKPLGGKFHFTSYLGLGAYLDRNRKTSLMLRYQHTSNAGLSDANPGVDMLGLTFSYHFGRKQQLVSATDSKQK